MSASRSGGIDASRRGGAERSGQRRPPPRPIEVVSVEQLTPGLVSVRLGGALVNFERVPPTTHLKVYVPDTDGRPVARTYTPRRCDRASGTLEVVFGNSWPWSCVTVGGASQAGRSHVGGPAGRCAFDPNATPWWIAGDESALPAVGTLLEATQHGLRRGPHGSRGPRGQDNARKRAWRQDILAPPTPGANQVPNSMTLLALQS